MVDHCALTADHDSRGHIPLAEKNCSLLTTSKANVRAGYKSGPEEFTPKSRSADHMTLTRQQAKRVSLSFIPLPNTVNKDR